jgi:hypothetical protein
VSRGALLQALRLYSRSATYWASMSLGEMEKWYSGRIDECPPQTFREMTVSISRKGSYFLELDFADKDRASSWLSLLVVKSPDVPIVLNMLGGSCMGSALICNAIVALYCCPGGENLCPMLMDQASDGVFK